LTVQPLTSLHYLISLISRLDDGKKKKEAEIVSAYYPQQKKKKPLIAISQKFVEKKIGY